MMDFLKNISEETVLIVPGTLKQKVLEKLNELSFLVPIKLTTLEELKKELLFDYDKEAILYLMTKYNYQYEVAKEYIENMYYVEEKIYQNEKLNFLVKMKRELKEHSLLMEDALYREFCRHHSAIVFGMDTLTHFDRTLLSYFQSYSVESKREKRTLKDTIVYSFPTLEEEVVFVARKIVELHRKNIHYRKITLANLTSEYHKEIIKIFGMYHIPIELSIASSLSSIPLVQEIMAKLKEKENLPEVVEWMEEEYSATAEFSSIYHVILSIFNDYVGLDYPKEKIQEAIEYELLNTTLGKNSLKDAVSIGPLTNHMYEDDEYVFLLGFQQGIVPKIWKDEDYISDSIKEEVELESTMEKNKMEKKATMEAIQKTKNITITYKKQYMDTEYYPSSLLELFQEETTIPFSYLDYSKTYNEILLARMLDNLLKYGEKSRELPIYYSSFQIPYRTYQNDFKGISTSSLKGFLQHQLVLSYSCLETFYECQFRYYLDHILKLNPYEETFYTVIGTLFHNVLSQVYQKDFDLDSLYDGYLQDKTFTPKETFFLEKLKKELRIVVDSILEFYQETGLTMILTEKNIHLMLPSSSDMSVIMKGIIDKVMYKEYDGKTLVSVIDYKTGHTDIDLSNARYGLGMQLLIYLYLIEKSWLFENYEFVGMYLQRILNHEVGLKRGKTYLELKKENLKLFGYSTTDVLSLERFDKGYENSEYIKSMKVGKNGFYAYAKVLDQEEIDLLIELVDEKIKKAEEAILAGDFSINPKKLSSDSPDDPIGCRFCNYQDICFRKNEDFVFLKKEKDLSFLKKGGGDNA